MVILFFNQLIEHLTAIFRSRFLNLGYGYRTSQFPDLLERLYRCSVGDEHKRVTPVTARHSLHVTVCFNFLNTAEGCEQRVVRFGFLIVSLLPLSVKLCDSFIV